MKQPGEQLTPHDVVEKLNAAYFELSNEDESISPFDFRSNGYADAIMFLGHPLWSSECEGREYEDDGMTEIPLERTVFDLYEDLFIKITKIGPVQLFGEAFAEYK